MAADKVNKVEREAGWSGDRRLRQLLLLLTNEPEAVTWVADAVEFLARTRNRTR